MVKRLVIVLSILVGLVSIYISGCETQEQEVKKLIKALQHKNSQVRRAAAGKLGETLALQDLDPEVRQYAAWALGMIGNGAKDAAPVLIQALKDPEVRDSAAKVLKKIGTPKALKAVKAYESLQ